MRIRYTQVLFGIAVTMAAGLAQAQELRTVHFKGVVNDYSPSTVSAVRMKFVASGPWTSRNRLRQFFGRPDDADV